MFEGSVENLCIDMWFLFLLTSGGRPSDSQKASKSSKNLTQPLPVGGFKFQPQHTQTSFIIHVYTSLYAGSASWIRTVGAISKSFKKGRCIFWHPSSISKVNVFYVAAVQYTLEIAINSVCILWYNMFTCILCYIYIVAVQGPCMDLAQMSPSDTFCKQN